MVYRQSEVDSVVDLLIAHRETMAALAQGALTLMRDQREQGPPSDAERIVGVLLDLLEGRDDLLQTQDHLYRATGPDSR